MSSQRQLRRRGPARLAVVAGMVALLAASVAAASASAVSGSDIITTIAGTSGFSGDGGPASAASLNNPRGVATDATGNLYIADTTNQRVRRVDVSTGIITTVAGTGTPGFSGNGGPAGGAQLNSPTGVTIDAAGNIYIADTANQRVRKVDTFGVITTVAGNGVPGFSGDGGPAVAARLNNPRAVTIDATGNLYIADTANQRLRRVDTSTGIITTVAGTGTAGPAGDGGMATAAQLNNPTGIAIGPVGTLYIADTANDRVRKIDSGGDGVVSGDADELITTVAGTGTAGSFGDGGPASAAQLNKPTGVAINAAGGLYLVDSGNQSVRGVDPAGIITTVAGTGAPGFSGDGGLASAAQLNGPTAVAIVAAGNLYIADTLNQVVRRVDPSDIITTLAGTPALSGDGGPASAARLNGPTGVATEVGGNLYIADPGNQRVRKVDTSTGIITTVAGTGTAGPAVDGGMATEAQLNNPTAVATDAAGNLYIADIGNQRLRKVDASTGIITTVAGTGTAGPAVDGGMATEAQLNNPTAVAADAGGNLYIADTSNQRVRRVDMSTGIISTVAGTGTAGPAVDGGMATAAQLNNPRGVVIDAGNLYIADTSNQRVRRVDMSTGIITTVAGNGLPGFSGDGGPASAAQLNSPRGVAIDAGNLSIADSGNQRVREVDLSTGIITTVAGTGVPGFSGDGGPASAAQLNSPTAVAIDAAGNLYVADSTNQRVRRVAKTPIDTDPPIVTLSVDGADTLASSGWYNIESSGTDGVLVHVSAADDTPVTNITCKDGATEVLNTPSVSDSFVLGDGQHSISCTASDGTHTGAATGSTPMPVLIAVDQTKPNLNPSVSPNPLYLNASGASASPDAGDIGGSGIATSGCDTVDTVAAGDHTVTCTATDNAGNSSSATIHFTVKYRIVGFLSPVPSSKWKAGTSVPVKVVLADANGVRIPDAQAAGLLSPTCRVKFSASGVQAQAAACMKYDAGSHQFVFTWKLGNTIGADTITVVVSYAGTAMTTSKSETIAITK